MVKTEKLMAVVKFILASKGEMSAAKLQKLVYFCHAYSLGWDGLPLFDNRVEAWIHGPIIPDLYAVHEDHYLLALDFFKAYPSAKISDDEIETIDAVLDGIGDKDGQWLSDLSHSEDPWRDARKGLNENERGDSVISIESMKNYYSNIR